MKSTKKNGPLPFINSQTPRIQSKNPLLIKEDFGSLPEFENNESQVKTQPTERKQGEMNLGLSHYLNRNFSQPDMFAPMSFSSIRMTPKTVKAITVRKKTERLEKLTLIEQISELKMLLNKYKSPDSQMIIPARLDLKKTVQCLEALSDVDSNLKDVMELIIKVLKGSVYVNPAILDKYNEEIMASDNEELKKIFMSSEQTFVPYFTLSVVLLNAFTRQEGKRMDYTRQLEHQIQGLTQQIQEKEETILNLQEKLQTAITKDIYSQIIEELRSARERASAYFEENKSLNIQIEELIDDNNQLNRQYEEECAEVEKRVNQLKEMEIDKEKLKDEEEDSQRRISEFKRALLNFENTFELINRKIEDMKKQFLLLQERNDELVCENERLNAQISANGTEALTPRPDYRTLQEEKKIELDIFDSAGKNQVISTTVVIEELMKKISELTQKNQDPSSKPINLTIANLNKRAGNRSRAGSFNVNSPLKPPSKNGNNLAQEAPPSATISGGGKSLFGRMAPRGSPSQFAPSPSQLNPSPSQFNPSPSQFAPGMSPNGKSQFFGNTLAPTPSIYDFKEKSPLEPPKDDYLSLKEDSLPSPESTENSPDNKTDSTPKSDGRYMLKIEIPKWRKRPEKENAIERANDLISYINKAKDEIENYVLNI